MTTDPDAAAGGPLSVWVELELEVVEGREDEFLGAIAANQQATLRDEPGCHFFDVVRLDGEGRRWAFYEVYRDAAAFFEEHRSAPHYRAWQAAVARTVVRGSQRVTPAHRVIGTPLGAAPKPALASDYREDLK
jgi:autoinducer 2-degrading protein